MSAPLQFQSQRDQRIDVAQRTDIRKMMRKISSCMSSLKPQR